VHEAAPAPAAKKGGKPRAGTAEVIVKDDWLAEHAAQVACMLPGGAPLRRRPRQGKVTVQTEASAACRTGLARAALAVYNMWQDAEPLGVHNIWQ